MPENVLIQSLPEMDMRKMLELCMWQFDSYEKHHKEKGTPEGDEKAATNAAFVGAIRVVLDMDAEPIHEQTVETLVSPQFHPDARSAFDLVGDLFDLIVPMQYLDAGKASLFYGKPYERAYKPTKLPTIGPFSYDNLNPEVLHALLGIITEAGELAERLIIILAGQGTIEENRRNIKEEVGDIFWFITLLMRRLGLTRAEVISANSAKLRKRFPDKFFTSKDAIERDRDAEAKALDGGE